MDEKIDFVILWVDDTDVEWQREKNKYSDKKIDETNSRTRYRDWGLLKYWFRCVEKNAPWVNKIYFITCGQKPEWLDENNEKLVLINHEDYIPNEYLPTFNSNVIELYANRIEGISNQIVFFNDDMYLMDELSPTDFFLNGKPVDRLLFDAVSIRENSVVEYAIMNNLRIISKYYSKKKVIAANKHSIYKLKNGKGLLKTILLTPWKYYTGIENPHIPIPILKSTMDEVWKLEAEELDKVGGSKFRRIDNYSFWLFRYWQLCSGNFEYAKNRKSKYYELSNDNSGLIKDLLNKKYSMICINDSEEIEDFEKVRNELIDTFEKMYPDKSYFEKGERV